MCSPETFNLPLSFVKKRMSNALKL
uniref:Uncharacterized protein n=1 Tax=Tetranychus urticae TaxID=32264 RepID=T1JRL4_TETUR